MSTMYALFQIVDQKYAKNILADSPDYYHFQDRISDWIKHNPDRWNEITSRLDYCQDLRQKGELGTNIDCDTSDIRWRLFIENGIPRNQLRFLSKSVVGDTCTIWTYLWPSLEISCRSRSDTNYPTEIVPSDDKSFPIGHPIWPFLNYSTFPSSDGTTDLWFSIWIPGNQFTYLTLDEGQLIIQMSLYDSSNTILIASDVDSLDLQVVRGILKVLDRKDRRWIRAMAYTGFAKVEPGRYNVHWAILGASDSLNEGKNSIEVVVARPRTISDLLVLDSSMTNENVLSGIVRGSLTNLYDNPECGLRPKVKFGLYFETTIPRGYGERFEVSVDLIPMSGGSSGKSELAEQSGKFVIIADSLGRLFINGEWQSPWSQKILDEIADFESRPKASKAIELLTKKFKATEGEVVPIQVWSRLKSDLRSGWFWLQVTVTDSKRQYFLSTRRVICIVSSSSIAF